MSRILYQNVRGYQVTQHSYSGGGDFACPRRYFHRRIGGWREKEERAALKFGCAVEDAILFFHNQNFEAGTGIGEFKQIWLRAENDPDITWTESSGSWKDHYVMGSSMLRLYEIMRPRLPLEGAVFQQKIITPLFPGTDYEGLEHIAKIDIISEPRWDHPLLPRIPEKGKTRKLVVDLKTAAQPYFSDPRLASLDRQLREYSWASGIETVSFLVFIKNISKPGVGHLVTLLEDFKGLEAGESYTVLDTEDDYVVVLNTRAEYDEYQRRKSAIKGKGAEAAKEELLAEYIYKGFRVPQESVTKCRIQFLPALISDEARESAEIKIKREAIEISDCNEQNFFPQNPGVRFPHSVCASCDCLGFCIGDEKLVAERLVQIGGDF